MLYYGENCMNTNVKHTILKNFFRIGLPGIIWVIVLVLSVFGLFSFEEVDAPFIEEPILMIINGIEKQPIGQLIIPLVVFLPFFFFIFLLYILLMVPCAFFQILQIPLLLIFIEKSFSLSYFILWLAHIAFGISFISAFKFRLGQMLEDSSYESGYHYEITYDADLEKATAKKVTEYSGGGEWLRNILLFFLRIAVIMLFGIIIFIFQTVHMSSYNPDDENETMTAK